MNTTVHLTEEMLADLKNLAERTLPQEESFYVNVFDCSGGNFDDAESLGYEMGETHLARHLLEKFNIKYNDPSLCKS